MKPVETETDSGNATIVRYTLAPEVYGSLVSQRRSGATSFHHFDALGSTDRLTSAAQAVTDSYLYRAFGQQSTLSGSSANRFTWVGKLGYYRQKDAQDYWVRAAIIRPRTGNRLERDLLMRVNRYAYADNNPANLLDPSGLHDVTGRTFKTAECGTITVKGPITDKPNAETYAAVLNKAICLLRELGVEQGTTPFAVADIFVADMDVLGCTFPMTGHKHVYLNRNNLEQVMTPIGACLIYEEVAISIGHEYQHYIGRFSGSQRDEDLLKEQWDDRVQALVDKAKENTMAACCAKTRREIRNQWHLFMCKCGIDCKP
jgi:hypothetical protein